MATPTSTSPTDTSPRRIAATSPASSGVRSSAVRRTTQRPSRHTSADGKALNELIRSDHSWNGYERNVMFANNRDGTFSEVSGAIQLDFAEDGRSFALADIDHDGTARSRSEKSQCASTADSA